MGLVCVLCPAAPGQAAVPGGGLQPAQVPVRRQPEGGAGVVHPHNPLVLVNGAEGIGTGWACKIPNYDPREIVNNINRMLSHQDPLPMLPSYKNFRGLIHELGQNQYMVSGEVSVLDKHSIEITELPVRTWTQARTRLARPPAAHCVDEPHGVMRESVLEPMLQGTEKTPPSSATTRSTTPTPP
ncbi:hypothetical protein AAFF_G00320550 [Aldrovandia affinis]|uniref:Topo IIA-type catalytic domain-containing protein n=1 Tax=Aldrovandia affinis TaxID=143900 RepID=A0AAD7W064_9TELE|nr:hypothetical protein AAFF_G00320550 [Aldrovandia affinis]